MPKFPFYKQPDSKDCGPTCLRIVSKHFGKHFSLQFLRRLTETTRGGSSLMAISDAAEKIGFRTLGVKLSISVLKEATLPCILHWNKEHFVVLYKVKGDRFFISDPAYGLIDYSLREFLDLWIGPEAPQDSDEGITLLLEPTPGFGEIQDDDHQVAFDFRYLFKYLAQYRKFVIQLVIGLLLGSLLQLAVPFLTQSIVDVGIKSQDIHFVYLILFAQVALFLGRSAVDVIRSWILLHLSTRINISLVSDFFIKLMKLPIAYFDTRMTGDIMQRLNDHKRIESILTTSSLNVLFSSLTFITFSFILAYYNLSVFLIFLIGSACYFIWITIFLKKRRELDHKRFTQVSTEQSKVIELINGMQEIKLHNAEKQKRWQWEHLQVRLFSISIKNLALEQYQSVGSSLINEFKNILITVFSATLVIHGEITLGMMLAISYIVGQLNSPIQQYINFIQQLQDARISLERLSEIHNKEDEDPVETNQLIQIEEEQGLELSNVSFRYDGLDQMVIDNLSLSIPPNKTTAIVGSSGSGKTTLMKMLLKFYDPNQGTISLGNTGLRHISSNSWRKYCGVVMQEGYIFNDTIAQNIALGTDDIDIERLESAAEMANIKSYIENLPLRYNTRIGQEGTGLSTGQKQRLLIARAIYKNPKFLFFDEATSALDANNEKVIMSNLNLFFQNKTVVVIAHRLSTVKNADQIVVLDKGKIIEQGSHHDLVDQKGPYFNLVRNQLELGT